MKKYADSHWTLDMKILFLEQLDQPGNLKDLYKNESNFLHSKCLSMSFIILAGFSQTPLSEFGTFLAKTIKQK